ncbi:MAG: ATP-binding protein [Bacteroidales bacterium]|nr:ATP-binding protein [Bacteroidales bacterium]MBR0538896.1 ATP-binding protein [Bacteroidales bacterium]
MNIPFAYGKIVEDADFTDRTDETVHLMGNFLSLTNTAIISPRRWGKSSLVAKAIKATQAEQKDILFVRMNVFKCDNPQEFYSLFAKKILEDISSSSEALLANAKEFIARLFPKLTIGDPLSQYELSLGVDLRNDPIGEDILDLPQQIATKKRKKVVVCIDEFQQIGEFRDTLKFQKTLRTHWQDHSDVAYILYGSKKHMMLHIFGEYNSPFYRFGDMMFLPKIANEEWRKFVVERFKETGKSITPDLAGYLAEQVENHPYYVQQLAQYTWLRTTDICSETIINQALQAMLDSLNLQFVNLMDTLTEKQRSFLCAVSEGVKNLSATATLQRYQLGTSGHIRILKDALTKRDLIDVTGKEIEIQDPLFKRWILQEYNKM